MLDLMLTLALGLQTPVPPAILAAGPDSTAIAVEGSIELSAGEAQESALRAAEERLRTRAVAAGDEVLQSRRPWWLPPFVANGVRDRWLSEVVPTEPVVLGMDTITHDYSYGTAFQATVHVAAPYIDSHATTVLEHRLRQGARMFATRCGGIALSWGLLALVCAWFDRLTRGYMTWRLRLSSLLAAAAVVPIALFC